MIKIPTFSIPQLIIFYLFVRSSLCSYNIIIISHWALRIVASFILIPSIPKVYSTLIIHKSKYFIIPDCCSKHISLFPIYIFLPYYPIIPQLFPIYRFSSLSPFMPPPQKKISRSKIFPSLPFYYRFPSIFQSYSLPPQSHIYISKPYSYPHSNT